MPPLSRAAFADGTQVPALGLGTWRMGEEKSRANDETNALRHGIDLGMTLIDTAEMYGDGGAERVVARATAGRRDEVFIVSKVYPHNAGARSAIAACERSLARLRTDRLDLYLLHWPGSIPLAETVDAFERLRRDGKIARWGVSNFSTADMETLLALADGLHCACNQVLYNLAERGIEWRLLDLCQQHSMPLMAYSPVGQGSLTSNKKLATLAATVDATAAQLALAWLMSRPNVIAIPKAGSRAHLHENRNAARITMTAQLQDGIDVLFPPPSRATPLAML